MHFGHILVKISFQTHKLEKLDKFWANFLKPEKLKLEKFRNFEIRKPQTRTPK